MQKTDSFSVLVKHLFGAVAGIYIAAFIGRLVGLLWPSAQPTAFAIAALCFVLAELSATIHELQKGRLSTGLILLDSMPFLLMGTGASLFLGRLASQWFGSDWGGIVVFCGVYYCILIGIAVVKEMVQERNLQDDLEHPRAEDPEEERKELRKYMHPYI